MTLDHKQPENSISKSQKKRDMIALQNIGEALTRLSQDALRKLILPAELLEAVMELKRIAPSKHGGIKRQMQYIGKLMREIDAAPIIEQLEAMQAPSHKQTALHHLAESWREKLLTDDAALTAFVNAFPDADRTALATLVSHAREDKTKGRPSKHFRLLYQALHKIVTNQSSSPQP